MNQEMTKEQARRNLSLPENADIETIRIRFAARYSQSDEAHDRALTPGMRAIQEAHLQSLESSYKILTDNPVIKDMGALLSLSKGYISEGGDALGDAQVSPEEALAFFALFPHDTPIKAEERYTQYRKELEEAIQQASLEASKEPYRKELKRAEAHLHIAVNYLMANEVSLVELSEEPNVSENEPEPGVEPSEDLATTEITTQDTKRKPKWLMPVSALLFLGLGTAFGLWWNKDKDTVQSPESVSVQSPGKPRDQQKTPKIHSDKQPKTENQKQTTLKTPTPNVSSATSPIAKANNIPHALEELASLLLSNSDYRLSEQSTENTWYLAPKDSTKRSFIIPVSNIGTLNTAGTLRAKQDRSFKGWYPGGTPKDVALVPGFIQSSAASVHRKKFMVTLERFGVTYELEKTKTEDLSNKKRDTIKEDKSRDTVKNIT